MSEAPPKLFYSYDQMVADLKKIYGDMAAVNYTPDVVIGITRGGLVPAVYVSHQLEKPLKTIEVSFRDSGVLESCAFIVDLIRNGKKVLLVDDICDSGETLEWIYNQVEAFNLQYPQWIKTAVLIHNDACKKFVPDFAGTHINKELEPVWIVFPFEK